MTQNNTSHISNIPKQSLLSCALKYMHKSIGMSYTLLRMTNFQHSLTEKSYLP